MESEIRETTRPLEALAINLRTDDLMAFLHTHSTLPEEKLRGQLEEIGKKTVATSLAYWKVTRVETDRIFVIVGKKKVFGYTSAPRREYEILLTKEAISTQEQERISRKTEADAWRASHYPEGGHWPDSYSEGKNDRETYTPPLKPPHGYK